MPRPIEDSVESDRDLVARVRAGEELAATLLYQRYAQRLFGFIAARMGSRLKASSTPDDVVQSVFRTVIRRVQTGHYDTPHGETLWNLLAVVGIRKLRNHARHFSAQCRDTTRSVTLDGLTQAEMASISPEEMEVALKEAVETLRPADQEITTLRLKNHTIEEISELTGRSLRTVERSLKRIREHFLDQIEA